MKTLHFDRITKGLLGINIPSPSHALECCCLRVDVADDFDMSKEVSETIARQKQNEAGENLFKDNIVDDGDGNVTWDEVTYYEKDDVALEPVPENYTNTKTVTLTNDYTSFTLEEVLQEKYRVMLVGSGKENMIADMFLNECEFDLDNSKANTGYGICILQPLGHIVTKEITLEEESTNFKLLELTPSDDVEIYLNDVLFVDDEVTLETGVTTCIIKIVNTTLYELVVRSFAIGY